MRSRDTTTVRASRFAANAGGSKRYSPICPKTSGRHESRCDGWTIRDVVSHLVGVNAFWEASVSAGLAGTPTQVLAAFDPAAHPPLLIEPMRALSPREVFEQFVQSNDGFLAALPDDARGWSAVGRVARRARFDRSPCPPRVLGLVGSRARHRDSARTSAPVNEPDEIGISLRYAAAIGPALTIGSGEAQRRARWRCLRPTPTFGSRSTWAIRSRSECDVIDIDAPCLRGDAADLVEALSVRAALPDGTPDEWHRLVHGLATVFDTELEPTSSALDQVAVSPPSTARIWPVM